MSSLNDVSRVHPLSLEEWREWLRANHATSRGVWLVTFKKATSQPRVEYEEAVTEALCWGWIDSVTRGLDEQRSMLYFSPRKKGSGWSRTNKQRLETLLPGRMQPAGLVVLEAAKADGSWTKLDEVESGTIPEDLAAEFARYPLAAQQFAAFPWSARRGILEWIVQAKTEPTRRKRVEETARLANENIRANQWSRKENT